jgi:hypothetical protein
MLRATANQLLPTTITGSLPRPSWYTENLGLKTFLQAMVETRFREQYEDALAVYFNEQAIAGLDIVTDGDARFTQDIGGQSWTSYPPFHMAGFDGVPKMAPIEPCHVERQGSPACRRWLPSAAAASASRAATSSTTTSRPG